MIFKSFIYCLFLLSIVGADIPTVETPKIKKITPNTLSNMIRPAYLKIGDTVAILAPAGVLKQDLEVIEKTKSDEYLVKFILYKDLDPTSLAQRIGNLPLPPYVRRPVDSTDEIRYQTVYAKDEHRSAVAAPTAGLHFTPNIFSKLELLGHKIHDLTLSVGIGTFRPIETENIDDHLLHVEEYILSTETQRALLARTRKHLAIGTTSVRSIEHYLRNFRVPSDQDLTLETNLFIKPPYHFSGTNHLLTNFHLPGSTLLCLVAAFLKPKETTGLKILKKLYAHAIEKKYRFFSYGDSMLIL